MIEIAIDISQLTFIPVQSQQLKRQKKVRNIYKVNNTNHQTAVNDVIRVFFLLT